MAKPQVGFFGSGELRDWVLTSAKTRHCASRRDLFAQHRYTCKAMATYQHISHGFDPVFDDRSRVLVLGSFPSVLSRKNDFYYGNPANRFWRIMAHVLGEPVPPNEEDVRAARAAGTEGSAGAAGGSEPSAFEASIEAKKQLLLRGRVALWDVIEECDIKGSSDASIKNVVPAHVERIAETTRIAAVVCNGSTSGRLYKRYLQWKVGIEAHVLPSTSPANAAWSLERLIQRWGEEFELVWDEVAAAEARWDKERAEAEGAGAREKQPGGAGEGSRVGCTSDSPRCDDADEQAAGARGGVSYGIVKVSAPQASSYAVHKSMQGNKRKDTKPELLVRERLRAAGLGGYRLQWKAPGRPDIAWPGKKVCVFVNGCFWHRCPHCNPSTPKKNVEYWTAKFARNVERDRGNVEALQADGWRVHTIWECELKKKALDGTMARLLPELASELGKPLRESSDAAGEGAYDAASEATGGTAGAAAAPEKSALGKTVPAASDAHEEATADSHARHFMYVIECADGTLYTGYTTDVAARFARHCAGTGAKYTRGRGPLNLLASAEFETKHDAMSAEYRFKQLSRDQKDALLARAAASDAPFEAILREELLS